jgi:hypothetical protein
VENRQWSINGFRPESFKRPSVPDLARALLGYMRGFVKVHSGFKHNVQYYLFQGPAFQVLIRGDDYAKIIPLIQNDLLDPIPQPTLPWRNGTVNLSNLPVFDVINYNRILGILQNIFPEDYPTSYL